MARIAEIVPPDGAIANIPLPIAGGASVGAGASRGAPLSLAELTPAVSVAANGKVRINLMRQASDVARDVLLQTSAGRVTEPPPHATPQEPGAESVAADAPRAKFPKLAWCALLVVVMFLFYRTVVK